MLMYELGQLFVVEVKNARIEFRRALGEVSYSLMQGVHTPTVAAAN
jgi:hypothetical protein